MTKDHDQKPSAPFLDPEHALLNALEGSNDERLWQIIRSIPDEDQALQAVAEEAPRMVHQRHSSCWFSELLLVPVIERSIGEVLDNRLNWNKAEICVSESLRAWLGAKIDQIIFRGVTPYEVICAWEPSTAREHLLAVAPGPSRRSVTVHPEAVLLPKGAPRLGFIVLAVSDRRGWPQLPAPDTLRDTRFRTVVGYALSSNAGVDVQVLAPDQLSPALADGLCLWLATLHAAVPIVGWDMSPCAKRHDGVTVTLNFAEWGRRGQFSVRRHQLAPVGLDSLALYLASLAPRTGSTQVQ